MKSVLITGAARGIGRELALAFGAAGYGVAVNFSQSREEAEALVKELPEALLVPADVRDSLRVREMIAAVVERWGHLDVLINNAGITRDRRILKMTNGEWNDVIDVNLNGVFWCLREAARVMSERKSGHIINIASRLAQRPVEGAANYVAAKAGVIGLTKAAATELGRFHIRVNAIFPGFHKTDMGKRLPEKIQSRVMAEQLLGETTHTDDLTRFIIQLADNKSVSGQVFNIDNRLI